MSTAFCVACSTIVWKFRSRAWPVTPASSQALARSVGIAEQQHRRSERTLCLGAPESARDRAGSRGGATRHFLRTLVEFDKFNFVQVLWSLVTTPDTRFERNQWRSVASTDCSLCNAHEPLGILSLALIRLCPHRDRAQDRGSIGVP